ncbi:GyrI-like domain-containing protein [Paenibacillus thailandensis]|uniref:GyrI-like domain-containing protein n=1 Tax=Paenibacillus thailandensis TaxID=393250 RepID=A0ABW5QWH5_9BACL
MQPVLTEFQKRKVVGVGSIGSPTNPGDVWPVLFARLEEVPGRVNRLETIGLIKRNEHGYIAGVETELLSEVPEGMVAYEIPAGKYAGITHRGPLNQLKSTFEKLVGWLADNRYDPYDAVFFEVYDHRYKDDNNDSEFDIFVQLKQV